MIMIFYSSHEFSRDDSKTQIQLCLMHLISLRGLAVNTNAKTYSIPQNTLAHATG